MPLAGVVRYLSAHLNTRLGSLDGERGMTKTETVGAPAATDALEIRDTRTGKSYTAPIADGAIRANDLRQIKTDADDFGLMTYDPAFMNTASCKSAITFIDGDKGILRYRGYPIEQLAEKATLPRGRVAAAQRRAAEPGPSTTSGCTTSRSTRTCTRTSSGSSKGSATTRIRCRCCAAAVAALSSFYPEAKNISRSGAALHLDHPAAREGARRSRRSATATSRACRSSIPTTTCRTSRTSSRWSRG